MVILETPVYPAPLQKTGALNKFIYEDTTPVIGREFPSVNVVEEILNADNSDELIRDLAITSMLNYASVYPVVSISKMILRVASTQNHVSNVI